MVATSDVNQPTRILVVEDTVELLYDLKEFLEREGNYTVITATNGVEGLQALEAQTDLPHLIISDILMPEMDGVTFLQELQKKPQYTHIPIIILSVSTDRKSEAMELGAAIFVSKPFEVRELLIAIDGVLATN